MHNQLDLSQRHRKEPDMEKIMRVERKEKIFLTWTTHHSCNYRCAYCFITTSSKDIFINNTYPGLNKLKEVWNRIYQLYGNCIIKLAGGEPFTYPQFFDLIEYLTQYHFLDFSSNLYWDVEEFVRRVRPGTARIEPSFHVGFCPDAEQFVDKCLVLKKHGFMGSIHTVAYPPFLSQLFKYKTLFENKNLNLVVLPFRGRYNDHQYPDYYSEEERKLLKLVIDGSENKIQPAEKQAAEHQSLSQNNEEIHKQHIREVNEQYFNNYVEKGNHFEGQAVRWCLQGAFYAKIEPNFDVIRCCTTATPEKMQKLIIGNLLDPAFKLLDGAKQCNVSPCGCWKTMIMGQEDKWKPLWKFETYTFENVSSLAKWIGTKNF